MSKFKKDVLDQLKSIRREILELRIIQEEKEEDITAIIRTVLEEERKMTEAADGNK